MEIQKQLLGKNSLSGYISCVKEYTNLVAQRDHGNEPTWIAIQESKVDSFQQKVYLLKRLDKVNATFFDYLENEATADFKALVNDVYETIVGVLDGSKREMIDRENLFLTKEIQQRMISVWGSFQYDVPELKGQAFLPHWRGEDSMDYSPGQLFLIKHASHFMFNVLKFEEIKRGGMDISAAEFAQYLVPVFFLPMGCLDFTKNANQCETGIVSLDYKTRTVVNI